MADAGKAAQCNGNGGTGSGIRTGNGKRGWTVMQRRQQDDARRCGTKQKERLSMRMMDPCEVGGFLCPAKRQPRWQRATCGCTAVPTLAEPATRSQCMYSTAVTQSSRLRALARLRGQQHALRPVILSRLRNFDVNRGRVRHLGSRPRALRRRQFARDVGKK